ncbi:MAG: polysaccharide biosynthesis/export family protein, partial [Planctomycetales bacterium]|nr:polysaccharide biosynthesis/export family protein [Planctomycetales bacterium]
MRRTVPFSTHSRPLLLLLVAVSLASSGCVASLRQAVPVRRLPECWLAAPKSGAVPIDFTLLRQSPPDQYILGPGDTLGIHIPTVIGAIDEQTRHLEPPPFQFSQGAGDRYVSQPAVGHPVVVRPDGTINLPLVSPISVGGRTITDVAEALRREYVDNQGILRPGRDHITVSLIKPRTHRVMVLREDSPADAPSLIRGDTTLLAKHGSGAVIELPAYENDVLHALIATGGLPGVDAKNEVWVLRNTTTPGFSAAEQLRQGMDPQQLASMNSNGTQVIRIPLRVCPGEPLMFGPDDVVLRDGDVVFIESRDSEYFYVGGLLKGARIELPRDTDLDVIGAIAMANGNINGPAGANAAATNFRSGPGNIVPPTRVIILRQLASGEQIKIHVDLKQASLDNRERILIQPEDVVMLHYTG